ncbi:hypothetical protein ABQJ54_10920 [Rhodanobacter sp. Si-c]|uniref:Uncharacterized protein n=1 Tax=Rhodanobacter lycopersici TaxID=3162487 RepID=A0ABV3QEJ5_9GAMM
MSHRREKPKDPLRFEFTGSCRLDEIATFSELQEDLYWDDKYPCKETPSFESLEQTLGFIEAVAGIKCKSSTDQLPVAALKTIKLLFLTSKMKNPSTGKKRNLFKIINPPGLNNPATMEFATTSSLAHDKEATALIHSLLEKLALEIDEEKLLKINLILKDAKSIMHCIEVGTYHSVAFLSEHIGNNIGLTSAYKHLAKKANKYKPEKCNEASIPLHEIVYTYLRSLGFIHFALHHNTESKSFRILKPIPSITAELAAFCETLNAQSSFLIEPHTPFVSVYETPDFVSIFRKQFLDIVMLATETSSYKDMQVIEDAIRAKKILIEYLWRNYEIDDPNAKLLSLHNIIAALCSYRYQRETGTPYEPDWPGRGKQPGNSPQRLMEDGLYNKKLAIPQGVFDLYYQRYAQYLFAFMGKSESNNAWMDFQSSRLNAYVRILQSYNIDVITKSIFEFDRYCLKQTAMAFANFLRTRNTASA